VPWLLVIIEIFSLGLHGLQVQEVERLKGVSQPESRLEITTEADKRNAYHRACLVFAEWVLIEVDDNSANTEDLFARRRPRGQSIQRICHARGTKDIRLPSKDVLGMVGRFVLLSQETFGGEELLWFYDSKTGKKVFEDTCNSGVPLIATQVAPHSVSLRYLQELRMGCRLDEAACWKETLQYLKLPKSVVLGPPVCPPNDGDFRGLQYFVPVHVDDIRHPVFVYEEGTAVCEVAP
jgi:hypothetical protein